MILLDTNVISVPLRASGDMNVLAWIDAQIIETLYLSVISLAELRFGIAAAHRFAVATSDASPFLRCRPDCYQPLDMASTLTPAGWKRS